MNMIITEQEIQNAFASLDDATLRAAIAINEESLDRTNLDVAKSELLASGQIDGKNAEIREGQIKDKLAPLYAQLALKQEEVTRCRNVLNRAQIDVDRVKTLLRLMEVLKP